MRKAAVLPVPVWAWARDVVVGQAVGEHAALDGRASLEAEIVDGPQQRRRQSELVEGVDALRLRRCLRHRHDSRRSFRTLASSMQSARISVAASTSSVDAKVGARRMVRSSGS